MNKDPRIYGNNFNFDVVRDVNEINEKIKIEESPEELMKLHLQRLYRGMELNSSYSKRNIRGYFPY